MPDGSHDRVYLSLGGNIGSPERAMAEALRLLSEDPRNRVASVSSLYRTPPWGKLDQPDFLNAVAAIDTSHAPRAFLDECLATERRLKRERAERWGPRLIDLDILLFGERDIEEPGLQVPHPRMLDRAFVIVPLAEIAPDLDLGGKTAADRAAELDTAGIIRLETDRDWWKRG